MEKLIRIIRISSKEGLKDLKSKNPIFCSAIGKSFNVTNIFYQHILGYKKSRATREIIERLSLINLVKKISLEGELKEVRIDGTYENKIFQNTYKIILKIGAINFNLILGEEKSGKVILLSCFVKDYRNFITNKKD